MSGSLRWASPSISTVPMRLYLAALAKIELIDIIISRVSPTTNLCYNAS
jgi:hypothetical protein